jgi:hypothetical protein
MPIQLVSARFIQSKDGTHPCPVERTPFAPVRVDLGRRVADPLTSIATATAPAQTPVVLVSSLIRPQELENPCPPRVEAEFVRTAGEAGASIAVTASAVLGKARSSLNFSEGDLTSVCFTFDEAAPSSVDALDLTLSWKDHGTGGTFATTTHRLLVTLGAARSPWDMMPEREDHWLWTEVVEVACRWAKGADSAEEAVRRIVEQVFALGKKQQNVGLRYDGATHYCVTPRFFDCAEFLRHLNGDPQIGSAKVNCMDTAAIVSTFANALGCDLRQGQCRAGMPKQQVTLIGDQPGQRFEFHEFAWAGAAAAQDPVADACLSLNGQVLPLIPFSRYAGQVFNVPPVRLGQTYPENRGVFISPALLPPPMDDAVETRARLRHPELANLDLGDTSAPLNVDWTPSLPGLLGIAIPPPLLPWVNLLANLPLIKPIVSGEKAWDFYPPFGQQFQARARISLFATVEEAMQYVYLRLEGVSGTLVQWVMPTGIALTTEPLATVIYKRANLIIVIQVRYGQLDLRASLQQLTSLLAL